MVCFLCMHTIPYRFILFLVSVWIGGVMVIQYHRRRRANDGTGGNQFRSLIRCRLPFDFRCRLRTFDGRQFPSAIPYQSMNQFGIV